MNYPKRLIEVDLPIKRISAHARREKSIRHGHISTLHIWWARRPLAACRAVICAALWPDPADPICPPVFRKAAAKIILDFARKITADTKLANDHCSPENYKLWRKLTSTSAVSLQPLALRQALLDFIADFANWDNSTVREYLDTSRALTQAAHEALGGAPGTRPLVVDPFCGGGSIPLEALRVGADAFASDLNPIPVLLNKVVLEYIPRFANTEIRIPKSERTKHWPAPGGASKPKHGGAVLESSRGLSESPSDTPGKRGQKGQHPEGVPEGLGQLDEHTGDLVLHGLADAVRYWGTWIKQQAEKELAEFYPRDPDGATPIAYLWARTIRCEGPGCGAEVPLIRALWLCKKANRSVALQLVPRPRAKRVDFQIIVKQRGGWVDQDDPKTKIEDPKFDGTVKRGSATCPCCGYTTPVTRVKEQLKTRRGGANDARLTCVVSTEPNESQRNYRVGGERDLKGVCAAAKELEKRNERQASGLSIVPDEPLPPAGSLGFRVQPYGMTTWADLFSSRQLLVLTTLARLVREVGQKLSESGAEGGFAAAVQTVLAQVVNKQADYNTSLCTWHYHNREKVNHTFGRQAIPVVWDFVEPVFFGSGAGSWPGLFDWTTQALENPLQFTSGATVEQANAAAHPLPSDSAQALVTDPPYYDAVPYSDLSDFFYVWFKRTLPRDIHTGFNALLTPKNEECIVDEPRGKDRAYFEATMKQAMAEGRRVLSPDGIGIVVFAHKSTAGWEAQLQAMIDAGWIMTGSWPIDTEMGTRLRAHESAALASSVHLVCRPRENPDGSVRTDEVGDWRDVLAELPRRIHDWMPRLAEEGVVGADAIFACLGPALEVFSRYSRVEKASGEAVPLKEYLEHVWAAVAKEALTMIFSGADTAAFEEDARLTAMWLWTLRADGSTAENAESAEHGADDDESSGPGKSKPKGGFILEFDAARLLAQGLGAILENLKTLVAVEGETARLLPVAERARTLFGKDEGKAATTRRKREPQMDLFKALQADADTPASFGDTKVESLGHTVLDRVHQSMILFAAGRGEALRRFLVEDAAGNDARFWTLAQALSALYPASTDEKRWVDGVMARKKGLGF